MFGLASRERDVWASGRWWIYVFMHASLTFLLDMAKAAATVALGIIAPARGPDGVTRREVFLFGRMVSFFTLLLLHKREGSFRRSFLILNPKPVRDVGRENCLSSRPCCGIPPKRQMGTRPIYQATNEMEGEGWLQTFARNKNEKTAERCVDQCYPRKAHECALVEEFPVIQVSTDSTRGEKA